MYPALKASTILSFGRAVDLFWSCLGHQGPKDTPYEAGVFELVLHVPEQYPLVPPTVRFRTRMFHPNVHFKVSLCNPLSPGTCCQAAGPQCFQRDASCRSVPLLSACRLLDGNTTRTLESTLNGVWLQTGEICLDILKTAWINYSMLLYIIGL
jgi:hypothetical protein